ncbi:hypothetical protein ABEX53_04070 [Bacillus toyonensis]|uniref:hypothetical protein n=1 Tax=Bacillus toyonensis TaxID=155322 RepID=UPI000CD8F9F7|nr:hypothetical protein [Bacillus toyonensis]MED3536236.1 hypothetical protein [Bacillus toyonensis]MEE2018279.1 hypothetical protein [Bacillus toyonensis]
MLDWLNNLVNKFANNPALIAATITGTVTFIAGILSQVLSHRFTKKREREKSLKEAITQLYSPLSIEIYRYLTQLGELTLTEDESKVQQALDKTWEEITKIIQDNKQSATAELSHNFRQTSRYFGDDIIFFKSFLTEFIKISKEVGFKEKIKRYTFEELLYLLKVQQLIYLRYGKDAGLYTFQVMITRHSISFEKAYKQLAKEKFDHKDINKNSFDDKFKILVLDEVSPHYKIGWEICIDLYFTKRKEQVHIS